MLTLAGFLLAGVACEPRGLWGGATMEKPMHRGRPSNWDPSAPRPSPEKCPYQYPYVVLPFEDGWQVLFVKTDNPYQTASFDTEKEALEYVAPLNQRCWDELRAGLAASELILRVQESSAAEHASAVRAARWRDPLGYPLRSLRALRKRGWAVPVYIQLSVRGGRNG